MKQLITDALQFIGIQNYSDFDLKQDYFNNPSTVKHDARHLYRTMIATALIAQRFNEPRNGLLAFCGAFIHDLAQRTDGAGPHHGPQAAKYKWHMFDTLWDKYCLTADERSNVRAAVSHHSGGGNSGFLDNKLVNMILHDADALDRCRFYSPRARLNWNYLSLPGLKCTDNHPSQMLMDLICETESIYNATKRLPSFMPFGDFLENIR